MIAKTKLAFTALILVVAITPSLPFMRFLIESSMAFHMLFQMPMLMLAGYLLNNKPTITQYSLASSSAQWLWIYFATTFWMLPISLDKALLYPAWDVFKIFSLLTTGAVLKLVFQAHRLLAIFFMGSLVMMLFSLGFYYQQTDVRLCSAYLIESQQLTGTGLIIIAGLLLAFLFRQIQQGLATTTFSK